jgi:hypothetical protein
MGVFLVPDELLDVLEVSPIHAYLKAGSLPKNKTNVINDMKSTRQITLFTKPILKGARRDCGTAGLSKSPDQCPSGYSSWNHNVDK